MPTQSTKFVFQQLKQYNSGYFRALRIYYLERILMELVGEFNLTVVLPKIKLKKTTLVKIVFILSYRNIMCRRPRRDLVPKVDYTTAQLQ